MSHPINGTLTSKTTNDFTQMVGELRKKVDANADGNVSTAEFAQFLTTLIDKAEKANQTPHAQASSSPVSPAPAEARAIDAPARLQAAALASRLRKG